VIKLANEEKETIFRCSAADREWDIVSADLRIINKLKKRGYIPMQDETPWGYTRFVMDFDRLRIGPAVRIKSKARKAILAATTES
jgi:hypothetical protein